MSSAPNLSLVLQFTGQYDPAVEAELQQLTAAIQQWANGFQSLGTWVDVPYDMSLFSTNSTGSITPSNHRPFVFQYMLVREFMFLEVAFKATINNTTTTEVRVRMPPGITIRPYADPGDNNQAGIAGIFNDGTNVGLIGVFVDTLNNCLSLQRWDKAPAASGYLNGSVTAFRASFAVRINPVGQ